MFSRRIADIISVDASGPHCQELRVLLDGRECRAINYPSITGHARAGDRVVINTTAEELGLGSGGFHFVYLNLNRPEMVPAGPGHIIKLRYTPLQLKVQAVEEETSVHRKIMAEAETLGQTPVVAAELHSMLAPFAFTLKMLMPAVRIAFLMTDGGALPAFFSKTARDLQDRKVICGVITAGHAFGGDLEAVTEYSGMLAAKYVLRADCVFISMGPGVAGTGTSYGFSGLEAGDNLNRICALDGRAVALPRLSFADTRKRHRGLSHHTLTALAKVALRPVDLPLPELDEEKNSHCLAQLAEAGIASYHRIFRYEGLTLKHLENVSAYCSTMGRSLYDDPAFFLAAAAAAHHVRSLLTGAKL